MATFYKHKVKTNGATTYRQAHSSVSVTFPKTAFSGEAPATIEIGADGLIAAGTKRVGTYAGDPAIREAKRLLAEARAARKAAIAARIANMTPEQLEKRRVNLEKMKARIAAKKLAAQTEVVSA